MGSLLSMIWAEWNSFKLTKSIYTCQGKKFPRNQLPKKFHLKISGGRNYLGLEVATSGLIAGTDVACPRKTGKINFMRKILNQKVTSHAAGRPKT